MPASVTVTINGTAFTAELVDNESARALAALLPAEFTMSELNGNEKYVYLDDSLPAAPERVGSIEAGDIMLFGSDCVVVFYWSFTTGYSCTRQGRIADPAGLPDAVGTGSAQVSFRIAGA